MARFVKIASVMMQDMPPRGAADAHARSLEALQRHTGELADLGLDLVVFSEEVEAVAQPQLDLAEQLDAPGPFLQAYQSFAKAQRCTVAGSVKLREGDKVYNSIAYIGPDGAILGAYHKTFLTLGELERGLSPGEGAVVVDTPAGRLGGAICYDLNFTELADQYAALRPDILTFASAYHGGLMQGWWAYRCRAYFVSALHFHGGGVLNPYGEPLALNDCYTTHATATVNLDRVMVHLDYNRDKFLDIRRQYRDRIDLHIPANVGSALLTSRADDLTAMDVVREYELELLDDYFARARAANGEARGHTLELAPLRA
ncbi:MAG: carbon-nitrogen hydrolase family protein [Phycisphaeraceae bacterium]